MDRPNFVFIMTDSQGANTIGAYGNAELLQTNHIDRLAAQGTRFEFAYSTCPVCTPARAGLFTGYYPSTSGPWANEMPLSIIARTMGQRFRDGGYRTAYVGKWHLSGQDYFDTGVAPDGWEPEFWFDGRNYLSELTEEEIRLWRQVLDTTEAIKQYDLPAEFTWGHRISDRAIKFLSQQQERPFVLALSYDEPHGPCTCPKKYLEPYENYQWDPGPSRAEVLRNKPAFQKRMQEEAAHGLLPDGRVFYPPFFACNHFIDDEIGRVLEAIDRLAPANTWVIFTSDHGQFMGAHGMNGKGLAMYEESARIPLIIRGPGQHQAGAVDPTLVSHIDILPTMLDLAGLEVPPALHGQSLKPNLVAGARQPDKDIVIEWNRADVDSNGGGWFGVRCLRGGPYKLVINLLDTDEFYDLAQDPAELTNRIDDPAYAQIRDRMHHRLMLRMNAMRDPFRGPLWSLRPWLGNRADMTVHAGGNAMPPDGYLPPTLEYYTGKPSTKLAQKV